MTGFLSSEQSIRKDVNEMMEQLRRFGVGEVSDNVNIALGKSSVSKEPHRQKMEQEIIYKDRLFLAKRRGDPLLIHIIADANCAYCRRLISLRWVSCPYCANGKNLPPQKY